MDDRDRAFAFDYGSSGKLDHLVLYGPGAGTILILQNDTGGFRAVYSQDAGSNRVGGPCGMSVT